MFLLHIQIDPKNLVIWSHAYQKFISVWTIIVCMAILLNFLDHTVYQICKGWFSTFFVIAFLKAAFHLLLVLFADQIALLLSSSSANIAESNSALVPEQNYQKWEEIFSIFFCNFLLYSSSETKNSALKMKSFLIWKCWKYLSTQYNTYLLWLRFLTHHRAKWMV